MKLQTFILLFLSILILFIIDLHIGEISVKTSQILQSIANKGDETTKIIIREIRLPRILGGVLSGFGLALSGILLQTLFTNPLAGPYILGISSGASFGIAFYLLGISFFNFTPVFPGQILSGLAGATIILLIIIKIHRKINNILTILILGVLISGILNSIINIFQYFAPAKELKKYVIWTMGSLESFDYLQILILTIIILLSLMAIVPGLKKFDLLYLGDTARTIGLHKQRTETTILVISGILAGSITSIAGPIAFVGIAAPHIARLVTKSALHKNLIPASMLTGGAIMLFADIISHLPLWTGILPINSITSLVGIPVVIYVLISKKKFSI